MASSSGCTRSISTCRWTRCRRFEHPFSSHKGGDHGATMTPEIQWGRLTAAEVRRRADANAIVLIPIGATEQHGPHLPTMVDHRLVFEVACRAARLAVEHE